METSVALIDDHHMVRKGLASIVNSMEGYRVTMDFPNGKEFVDALNVTNLPQIAIVDLSMPVMNGFETMDWLRKNAPSVRALALTFDAAEDAMVRAIRSGARGFLLKEAPPSELKLALDSLMLTGYYHTEDVLQGMMNSNEEKTVYERQSEELGGLLTAREMEFLLLVCAAEEHTYEHVAELIGIQGRTVDYYRKSLFEKLNVKSKVGMVLFAARHGLLPLDA